jgi:adenosylhomocysteine nucleosidase
MTLAFITGLTSEARLLRRLGHKVFVGGGTSPGATRGAEEAVGAGATSLISFGLAGGLDPALPSGSLIRPRRVLWRGQVFLTDTMFGVATCDALLAHDAIAATATEKQGFWADTGAAAIDMESGAVGEVAARHGLGFGVLRAICDPAARTLPPAALAALDKAGRIGFLAVAASVLRQPGQIPALLALAADAARARKALIAQAMHDYPAPTQALSV